MHTRAAEALNSLAQRNLRVVGVLQQSRTAVVSLMSDPDGRRFVLKQYAPENQRAERERKFLLRIQHERLDSLKLPKVLDAGSAHLILEFIPREQLTRETILDRDWTDEDIGLWVDGLLEFQRLRPPRATFRYKDRLLGLAYPVVRTIEQLRRYDRHLTKRQWLIVGRSISGYLLCRPFFRNVCVHYDLQTSNYSFMATEKKMSILDFGFSYYLGDPYFDILYYITIPPVRINQWTFQAQLLKRFMSTVSSNQRVALGRGWRVRLILLCCSLSRYFHFEGEGEKQDIYAQNIHELLDDEMFSSFWQKLELNEACSEPQTQR